MPQVESEESGNPEVKTSKPAQYRLKVAENIKSVCSDKDHHLKCTARCKLHWFVEGKRGGSPHFDEREVQTVPSAKSKSAAVAQT